MVLGSEFKQKTSASVKISEEIENNNRYLTSRLSTAGHSRIVGCDMTEVYRDIYAILKLAKMIICMQLARLEKHIKVPTVVTERL